MKITVITSENGAPLDRGMLELADTLSSENYEVEQVLWEDEESNPAKALYDILQSPALLLTHSDGSLLELWQGEVPTASEIRYRCSGV